MKNKLLKTALTLLVIFALFPINTISAAKKNGPLVVLGMDYPGDKEETSFEVDVSAVEIAGDENVRKGTIYIDFNKDKTFAKVTLKNVVIDWQNKEKDIPIPTEFKSSENVFKLDAIIQSNIPIEINLIGNNKIAIRDKEKIAIASLGSLNFTGSGSLDVIGIGDDKSEYIGEGLILSILGDMKFNLSSNGHVKVSSNYKKTNMSAEKPYVIAAIGASGVTDENKIGDKSVHEFVSSLSSELTENPKIIFGENNIIINPTNYMYDKFNICFKAEEETELNYVFNTIYDKIAGIPSMEVVIEYKEPEKYEPKDETCEAVIGPNWTWDEELGVCKEVVRNKVGYKIVNTATY